MEKPLVSWLMPMYNDGQYAKTAIESMFAQTYQNFEIVIVLDPSDEETESLCTEYENKDNRIRVLRNKTRQGISGSLNIGLKACRGKYIARMDADDYSYPERLEKQVSYMEQHPEVGILAGNLYRVYEATNEKVSWYGELFSGEEIKAHLLFGNCLAHPTIMLRASLEDLSYPEGVAEDYALYTKYMSKTKIEILPDLVLEYLDRTGSAFHSAMKKTSIRTAEIVKAALSKELNIDTSKYDMSLFELKNCVEITKDYLISYFMLLTEALKENERLKRFDKGALLKIANRQWHNCLWRAGYLSVPMLRQDIQNLSIEKLKDFFIRIETAVPDKIVIFGTGVACNKFIAEKGTAFMENVVAFCDSDPNKQGKLFEGKKIVSPSELEEVSYTAILITSTKYELEIREQLVLQGISATVVFGLEEWAMIKSVD